MSAGSPSKWHKIARTAIAMAAGGSYFGLQQSGYVEGAATDVGDAGAVRDIITAALAAAAVWYPKFQNFGVFWSSLTNDSKVAELEAKVEELQAKL